MCGIAGIIGYRVDVHVDEAELIALRDAQEHRGADDAGVWRSPDGRVGLAHRRLSILDLSPTGHQPMATLDGRFQLVFNGEIYNFREIRSELIRLGHEFASTGDTEVVLLGYQEWGPAVLDRLRGMFAFAIHDTREQTTFLARDALGIKPLYYLDDGRRVLIASEIQALRSVVDVGGNDPEALARFLLWGSIPAPRTIYSNVRALPAGCSALIRERGMEPYKRWFSFENALSPVTRVGPEDAADHLRAALRESVRYHLVSDVPVGAFLSGGVDSSALVGLLAEQDARVRTVTLSLDVEALDEGELAREAAEQYGSDHREIPLRIDDIRDQLPDAIRALDQPSNDGINTYFVAQAAVAAGLKVAVSGVGGDELFGGYSTFADIPRIRTAHRLLSMLPGATTGLYGLLGHCPRSRMTDKLATALRFGGTDEGAYFSVRGIFRPDEIRTLLADDFKDAVCEPDEELKERVDLSALPAEERVSALEFQQYLQMQLLRDTDAVSMRHSLEVRTPLVDRQLLEAAARVSALTRRAGPAKKHLRNAPTPPVPDRLWNRKKQGFTLPFDDWLRSGSMPLRLPDHPMIRPGAVKKLEQDFRAGRIHVSRILMFHVLSYFLD